MLNSIFTSLCIDFNWNFFGIKIYFMLHLHLVSKSTIGILKFLVYLQVVLIFILSTTIWFHWYHNSFCWLQEISKVVLKVVSKFFKIYLIYIAYMQGELNISSIYRFMLSVFYILMSLTSLFFMWYTCIGGAQHLLLYIVD